MLCALIRPPPRSARLSLDDIKYAIGYIVSFEGAITIIWQPPTCKFLLGLPAMSFKSALIAITAASAAAAIALPSAATAKTAPATWSAIPGTVSRSFVPEATFCPKGSGNDCLAVGYDGESTAVIETNTTGTWQNMPDSSPGPGQFYASYLYSISCPTRTFCAAVGNVQPESDPEAEDPLVAIFDGSSWSFQELDISTSNVGYILTGVSCANPQDCVAVGRVGSGSDFSNNVIASYGGQSWTTTLLPNPGNYPNAIGGLAGVSCPSANWCTAVGFYSTDQQEDLQGFAEKFRNGRWALSKTPLLTGSNALFGIDCPGNETCIAVGDQAGQGATLIEQLSKKTWSTQGSSEPGELRSVACANRNRCAAAGYNGQQPLIMTYSSQTWSSVTAANPLDETYNLAGVSCANRNLCLAAGWGIGGPQSSLEGYLMSGPISG
jgi:hypothetical protein